jgi:hypothetical protein
MQGYCSGNINTKIEFDVEIPEYIFSKAVLKQ